ncbi:hypothetical protein WN944_020672 [Citrus x changshan-huyou]|uniref:Uncharacterized protein n=1 Tax=Citrus x changshan-huyou TaxID=2935761 RepID=A0AAP0LYZ9_9ROSI
MDSCSMKDEETGGVSTWVLLCIGFGRSMSTRRELLVEDGKVAAANAIGTTIMKLDKGKLGEDE